METNPTTEAPGAGHVPFPWRRCLFIAAALGVFALWRWAQLTWLGPGIGNDVHLYRRYAIAWGSGALPYVGFQPEYPPAALPVFLLPFLYVGVGGNYPFAFAIEMAVFDLAAYSLVLLWARRLQSSRWWPTIAMGALYLTLSAVLYPILYTRFDIVPGALVLAALTLAYLPGWLPIAGVVLGVAGAVKLWPFALGPMWLLLAYRRGRWPLLVLTGLGIGAGALLFVVPLLPAVGTRVLGFLDYHAARGIQIGSTWASLALMLNLLGIHEAWVAHEFGAFHVKGPAADVYARWSMLLLPVGVLLPQAAAFFGRLGRAEDERGAIGARVAAATILGFMAVGKVLSPQFSLWILPLLPLVCRGWVLALMALGFAAGTTIEYPFVSSALEMRAPGHTRALLLVATRNTLLIALFIVLVWRSGAADLVRTLVAKRRARAAARVVGAHASAGAPMVHGAAAPSEPIHAVQNEHTELVEESASVDERQRT